jgi:hypothetical protein
MKIVYMVLVGKRGRKGKPCGKWEDNIKMDISEIGWEGADWIYLAQDEDQWRGSVNRQWTVGFHKIWIHLA